MTRGFRKYLTAVLIIVYIFYYLNEVENAEHKKSLKRLLLAQETEKRIIFEFNRKIEELKKDTLVLELATKQQYADEVRTKKDFLNRIKTDEDIVKDIEKSINNYIDLHNETLDKISIAEKRLAELKKKLENYLRKGKNYTNSIMNQLEKQILELEIEMRIK